MSTIDAESGEQQTEKEPITDEGKAKADAKDSNRKSLRVKIRVAQQETAGNKVGFAANVVGIIIGSIVGLIAIALADIIHVAQIVIGALYINDCPIRPGIPIILIIHGSVVILESIIESINKRYETVLKKRGDGPTKSLTLTLVLNIIRIVLFITFITWCVLVYGSVWPEFDNSESNSYCHSTLYLFAFWMLNIYFIFLALFLFCCCCCCCLATRSTTV